MPQLDPNPWFLFFILSMIVFFVLLPMKVSKFPRLNDPKLRYERHLTKPTGTSLPSKMKWALRW
uniref:ATP synthase complex subunit 8 n=1 Tax=Eleutherodactylus atkinsi TaxID=448426 RepID=S4V249_9NEOB|nr:ATP synthase F0 subunit 8 [Eleutherodactylus atkinsi]